MTKKKKIGLVVIVSLSIVLIIAAYLRVRQNAAEASARPPMIASVILGKVSSGDIEKTETLTGDILPIQQAEIYARVSGNIEKIYVDIGDYVRAGQVLALIDTTLYSQNAKQAYANYTLAAANLENAKINNERNSSLFKQNLIAKQDADNARTAYEVALAQKEAAYSAYKNSMTLLGYCKVTAPFPGYITKRAFDAGAYVSLSVNGLGSVMFTIMDYDRLKAVVNLPEKDIAFLSDVLDIKVVADALPGQSFNARLSKSSGAVDMSTRTMQTEILIENTNKQLKPGMFASIEFTLARKSDALRLPNDVILEDKKGDFVYVVNQDTIAFKKYISIGIETDTQVEVLSGISDNDKIVFSGQTLVKNGAKVRIIK